MIVGRGIPCRVVFSLGQLRSIERFRTVDTVETVETVETVGTVEINRKV